MKHGPPRATLLWNKELHARASVELKESLAKRNLTVERYNRIYTLVNGDEALRRKALQLVEEERKRSMS